MTATSMYKSTYSITREMNLMGLKLAYAEPAGSNFIGPRLADFAKGDILVMARISGPCFTVSFKGNTPAGLAWKPHPARVLFAIYFPIALFGQLKVRAGSGVHVSDHVEVVVVNVDDFL